MGGGGEVVQGGGAGVGRMKTGREVGKKESGIERNSSQTLLLLLHPIGLEIKFRCRKC